MTSTFKLTDWREKAAAAAQGNVADDMAVEKAFMDQAYAAIQNKCGPLMRSPHQIGFEIVHKNDAATRMVGLFGFRAGRQLFYAPVFFLSGEIKGTDLLYRHLTKTIVPLNEEWVVYLIEGAKSEMGRGISKSDASKYPIRMNLDMLAFPPMTGHQSAGKRAADESAIKEAGEPFSKEELFSAWEQFFDSMEKPAALQRQNVKAVVLEIGMPAVEKIASLIEQSLAFATELQRNIPSEDWMPVELLTNVKQSSEEQPPAERILALQLGGNSMEFAKFGFEIVDQRDSKEVNTVYEEDGEEMRRASEPGAWGLLMADGSMQDGYIFHADTECCELGRPAGDFTAGSCHPGPPVYDEPSIQRMVIVLKDDKASSEVSATSIHGTLQDSFKDISKDLVTTLKTNKGYRAVHPLTAVASSPFVVVSKKTRDGVVEYRVRTSGYGPERIITVNPDSPHNDFRTGAFNEDIRFVEVKVEKFEPDDKYPGDYRLVFNQDVAIGNEDTLDAWLRTTAPIKKASIKEDPLTGTIEIQCGRQIARVYSKMAAAGVLARDMHIDRDTVFQLLGDLDEAHHFRRSFTLWEKSAAQLRLMDEPNFQTYTDSDFGVTVDPSQQYRLRTMRDESLAPEPRVGDAWDPTLGQSRNNDGFGDDRLLSMDPAQIAAMSQQGDTPAVFDHGVIGSLVHTFDANALVESYLPKLEDAVDALGRTLFLFYWKPSDFEMSYGADDMLQLENQFTSNFKSLGAVLLELLKRSKQKNQNNRSSDRA